MISNFKVKIGGLGPLETELKQFSVKNRLTGHVSFYGFVDEKYKPRFLAGSTVAVFPSSGGESFGIVLLEAMAAGGPVVLAGDNPGYRSVLGERPELLVDPHNAGQLAEKLRDLLADDNARQRLLEWQAKHLQQFEVARVGTQLVDMYEQALRQRQKMR